MKSSLEGLKLVENDLFQEMELEFPIGRFRPEKQDYLLRCPAFHLLLFPNLISGSFCKWYTITMYSIVGAVDFFLDRFSKGPGRGVYTFIL